MQGCVDEARALFERLLKYASHLGLFSEEINSQNGMALGNYPQAFTHIALINSVNNLRKAEIRWSEHRPDRGVSINKPGNNAKPLMALVG
jgi:GH15 family glucan-1,4-alpha-glucosidase